MNKATGENRGDQRRGTAPSRANHGAGAEMIDERSRSQRKHNRRPDGSANLCRAAQIRCAIRSRVFENSPVWPPLVGLRLPEDEEEAVLLTRRQAFKRKLADIWSSVAGV
jgi:hypothetical protein